MESVGLNITITCFSHLGTQPSLHSSQGTSMAFSQWEDTVMPTRQYRKVNSRQLSEVITKWRFFAGASAWSCRRVGKIGEAVSCRSKRISLVWKSEIRVFWWQSDDRNSISVTYWRSKQPTDKAFFLGIGCDCQASRQMSRWCATTQIMDRKYSEVSGAALIT